MDRKSHVYEKFIALFVFVVFAYFALGARPAYEFYTNPVYVDYLRDRGPFWEGVSYLILAQPAIFLGIVVVGPLCIILAGDDGPSIDIGKFALLGWPVLGYLLSRRFDDNSPPYYTFLGYCVVSAYVLAIQAIELILLLRHRIMHASDS